MIVENLVQGTRIALAKLLMPALMAGTVSACGSDPDEMVASAKQYLASNDRQAASIQLKNALQETPDHAEARFLLGRIYASSGDYAAAARDFDKARKAGYPEPQVVPQLALAMLKSGDDAALIERFAALKLQDETAQAALQAVLGDAYVHRNRLPEARAAYERALGIDHSNARARIGIARLQANAKDLDGARKMAEAVLAESGPSAEAYELLAGIALAQGNAAQAIGEMRKAIAAEPTQPVNHFRLISMLIRDGKLDQARAALDEMKKATGGRQVYALYLQSYLDFLDKKDEQAAAAIAKVVGAAPDFLPARLLAGAIHLRSKDYNQALQQLGVVLSAAPGHALARRLSALAYLMAGNPDKALEMIDPLLEDGKADNALYQIAGQAHLAKGDFDRSAEYFEKAAKAQPGDAATRVRLGVSRIGIGEAEQGLADLAVASKLDEEGIQADVALAMVNLRQGKSDETLKAVEEIERKQPKNPLGPNLRGGALLAKGDSGKARAAFEAALAIEADYLPAAVNLARLDLAEGKADAARQRMQAMVKARPKDTNAYLALVDVMARSGATPAETEVELRRGAAAVPDSQQLKIALVQSLIAQDKTKDALAIAQAAQAAAPEDPQVMAVLGTAQLRSGQTEQAVATFGQLAARYPDSLKAVLLLARAQELAGNASAVDQTLSKAVRQFPGELTAAQALVAHRLQHRDTSGAASVARDWINAHPESADGYLLMADVSIRQSEWKAAIENLNKAQQIKPLPKTAIALHAALIASGDEKGAARQAADWIKAHPKGLALRGYLAETALRKADYKGAVKYYKEMLETAPDNPLMLNNLAWASARADLPDAVKYAERALELAPDNPAILDTVGMIRSQRGEHAKAKELLLKAVSGAPKVVPIALNLARVYARAGEPDKAREVLDRVERENPGRAGLKEEAQRIRASL